MRGRLFDIPAIGRTAGFALVAAAIVATAVHLGRDARSARFRPADAAVPFDPLASEMRRCEVLAMAAKDDAACEAAWAENRRRFFTYRPAPNAAAEPAAVPNSLKQ